MADSSTPNDFGVSQGRGPATMSVAQASRLLNVTDQTVRNLLERGALEGNRDLINQRRRWSVSADSVHRLLARQAAGRDPQPVEPFSPQRAADSVMPPAAKEDHPDPGSAERAQAATATLAQLLHDAIERAEAAELRAHAAEMRADQATERAATLEAVLVFQTEAKERALAALESEAQTQRHLRDMAKAEHSSVSQLLHPVPVGR
jgi:excisionase family DNA binding protein